MRLRYAIPLLSAAASFMVASIGFSHLAAAQPEQGQRLQLREGTRRVVPGLRKSIGQLKRAAQPAQQRNAQRPAKQAGPAADEAGGGTVPQFETGTDYQPTSPRTLVTFNLEDADLPDLVRLISTMTGKRFILPGKVRSIKATVFAPTKVSVSEAYRAFLSILEVNGLTTVPRGRYIAIEETANIENRPIPVYTGNSPTPPQDRYLTRFHRVSNVGAEDVATLLGRFKSAAGQVTAYAPTNTLIITDTGTQIRRMLRIVEAIDVPRTGEQIWIEPIHYATAAEIAERLSEIFPSSGGASSGSSASSSRAAAPRRRRRATKTTPTKAASGPTTVGTRSGEVRITNIIADERTNSLIILATERAYLRILEMVRHLDIPLEGEGRIHVHYVQNGDAAEIATTLQSLIGGGSGSTSSARTKTTKAGAAARRSTTAGAGLPDLFEGNIRVTTHEPTNALVITSSLHDYASLRRVIERLDRPRRQVFIEAVVMELSVNRSEQLGLSFHGGVPDLTGDGDGSVTLFGFNPITSLGFPASSLADQSTLSGLAVGVRGPDIDATIPGLGTGVSIPGFGVVLNALATSGDVNVLSTPHIIAMNNVQAEINVGQNVPLQQSGLAPGSLGGLAGLAGLGGAQAGGAAGGLGGLAGLAGGLSGGFGVPRQDVGTIIRITPHINELDEIRLEIEEEISEVGAAQGDLGVVPINRRVAKTEVQVRDQQTVVIGGLVRESVNNQETKVPVLGDIPLLGALFRRTQRQTQKNNLLLFLTPYIIRDMGDLRAIYERKMRERQEFLDRYFVFGDHDYEPPVDYSRTRGVVMEIINELDAIDEEAALLAAAEAEPPPEHVPREPVGTYEIEEGDTIIGPDGEEDLGDDGGGDNPAPTITPTAIQTAIEQQQTQEEPSE